MVALVAVAIVLSTVEAATGAAAGQIRLLAVMATWGPTPFERDDVQRMVVDETAEFFRVSSGGRLTMTGTTVDWVRLEAPRSAFCRSEPLTDALRAARPDVDLAAYDRVAWVVPQASCGWTGEAQGTHVVLNGSVSRALAAHELGHTFGLGHASRWDCAGAACSVVEYGGGFSVMGGGQGDFNAFEKNQLEWLGGVVRPDGPGTHAIAPIEGSTTQPQAFVVTTASAAYWLEARSVATEPFGGGVRQPPGVVVLAGPPFGIGTAPSRYPRSNLVLPNPTGGGRFAYAPGETFRVPGVFEVAVDRNDTTGAALRFAWLDRTPPPRPRLIAATRRRTRVTLEWEPSVDRGSGRIAYVLLVDGRDVRRVGTAAFSASLSLARGAHRVGVAAIDRAGNRGAPATVRVIVR